MKVRHLIFAAMATFALASCNKDDDSATSVVSQFPEDGVMRFTTNLNDAATVQTRASMTTSDLVSFQVKIVNQASTTYSYFETVSKSDNEWLPANTMLWQNNTQAISMTAAALSGYTFTDDDFTDADGVDLIVAEDQGTQDKLNAEDLLTMSTKIISNPSTETTLLSDGKLVVSLYHGLAKLNVTLTLNNEFYAARLNSATDITEMTISGTNLAYNFKPMVTANDNYGTVAAAATATMGDILPFQGAFTAATETSKESVATYESIVVPQTIAAGALTVSFKIGTRSFTWTNTEAYTLEQGKLYTLPLTVGNNTVTAGANSLTVSAWSDQTASGIATE